MTTEKKFNKRHNQGVRKEQTPNSDDGVPSKNGRNFHIVESVLPPEGWK